MVRQSAQRFPKASRCYLLLPVLWAATILMFLYNNVMLKRGETLGEMRRVIGRQDFLENIKTSDEVGKKH